MNTKRKPIVGEILYDLNVGNAARRREQKLIPVTVTSVGRKYFTCLLLDYKIETTYHIDTWRQKTKYCEDHALYETQQEWLDECEVNQLHCEIKDKFFGYGPVTITLETLRSIKKLLSE